MLRWILNRFKVSIYLKSGQVLKFTCADAHITSDYQNQLTKFNAEYAPARPDYLRLDDVSAIVFCTRWGRNFF